MCETINIGKNLNSQCKTSFFFINEMLIGQLKHHYITAKIRTQFQFSKIYLLKKTITNSKQNYYNPLQKGVGFQRQIKKKKKGGKFF